MNDNNHSDHDLLIRIDARVGNLDQNFAQFQHDHEKRVRRLEKGQWVNWGAITASVGTGAALLRHIFGGKP